MSKENQKQGEFIMNTGKTNLVVGGLFLVLVAFGGFALGYTLDPLVTGGFYKMSYPRLLMRGAHSHGMLFALFNLVVGFLINRTVFNLSEKKLKVLSISALISMLLPVALLLRGFTHPSKAFLPLGAIGGLGFIIACAFLLMGAFSVKRKESAPA
jgi:hypothetical protein